MTERELQAAVVEMARMFGWREREGSWGEPYERAMAASDPRGGEPYQCEEERDRLQERCARLQQALEEIETLSHVGPLTTTREGQLAREALAGPDTPADSQEDKT